jgi:hypothetical protein
MDLPEDTPRLPKIPFLLTDIVLLAIAAYLAYQAGDSPTLTAVIGIIVCAGLGAAAGIIPFILDYARQQDLQMRDRERIMENLVQSTSAAADQASIAASGLNEIAQTTKTNLHSIEALPAQVAEARNQALKASEQESQRAIDELKAELGRLVETIASLQKHTEERSAKIDQTITKGFSALQTALDKVAKAGAKPSKRSSATKPAKEAASKEPTAPSPEQTSADAQEDASAATEGEPPEESAAETVSTTPAAKPKRARKRKSPEPTTEPAELSLDSEWEEPDDDTPKTVKWEVPPPKVTADESPGETGGESPEASVPAEESTGESTQTTEDKPEILDEPAPEEPALSADGTTRLTVTAYIGIGNRLFIRGNGPGLSSDEGVPLQFVSIGKWRWETDAATAPMRVTLWKNDEEECSAVGEIELKPGAQLETSANF